MMKTSYGLVSGRVQGVGFRYFVRGQAEKQQLSGWARNLEDGRVEVLLCGRDEAVAAVQQRIAEGPALSRVDAVEWSAWQAESPEGFTTG